MSGRKRGRWRLHRAPDGGSAVRDRGLREDDLADGCAKRGAAADRVAGVLAENQGEVGTVGTERWVAGRLSSSQACHHPCCPQTTLGSRLPSSVARARTSPLGVHTSTQSPFPMPRSAAVSRCISIAGSGARLRSRATLRCWVSQKCKDLAQVRISGKLWARSPRDGAHGRLFESW
jgi:hypothetical protein